MGKFDHLIKGGTQEPQAKRTGGKFDYLINTKQPQRQAIEIPQVEQPPKLTQIAGGFQEAIGGTGETFGERLFGAAKKVGKKVLTAGAELVAKSRPAAVIANIEAGMKPVEAFKKAFIDIGDTYMLSEFGKEVGQRKVSKEEAEEIVKKIERKRTIEVVTGGIGAEAPKIKTAIESIEAGAKATLRETPEIIAKEIAPTVEKEAIQVAEKTPLELSKISPKTKMGDVLEQARARGFEKEYEGVEFGKPGKFDRLIKGAPEAKPAEITPVEVAPVEVVGETKVRGLAKGIEAKAVENKITQGFGELPEYQVINKAEQAQKATTLLGEDLERAKRIAMGTEKPPADILPESVFIAVEEHATKAGDIELLRKLATNSDLVTQATTMGQRISMLAERNPDSAITNIQKVVKERIKSVESKFKKPVSEVKQDVVKEIQTKVKQPVPSKETWTKFIEEIQCK